MSRESSPEFSLEYERQQHFIRLAEQWGRKKPTPKSKRRAANQAALNLRTIKWIEIIQMADLPRYHYEVFAIFDNGIPELLQLDYVHGLANAVRLARERWGSGHRIELCRWHPKKHRPNRVLFNGAEQ